MHKIIAKYILSLPEQPERPELVLQKATSAEQIALFDLRPGYIF